jgi:Cu+-exporting ATPase
VATTRTPRAEAGSASPSAGEPWTLVLGISGMTCAACAARVQRTLNKVDGVTASVNFATGKATATVSPAIPAWRVGEPVAGVVADLIDAVARTGYAATLPEPRLVPGPCGARDGTLDGEDLLAGTPDPAEARRRSLRRRLMVSLVLVVPLGDLSIASALTPRARFPGWQWVLLVLAAPVATWCAWPFHLAAVRAARHRTTTMDTLISLGVIAAAVLSVYTMFVNADAGHVTGGQLLLRSSGAIYLDVVAGVTVFVLIGRVLEAQARRRTGGALRALAAAGARNTTVLDPDGRERIVPTEQVRVGDRLLVRPGDVVPTDGEVLSGRAAIDQSSMTGESRPVEVRAGDAAVGGTVALDGLLTIRATRVGRDTRLAQLVAMVERAQGEKAAIQRLADRVSGIFVPLVLALAAATAVGWGLATGSPGRAFSPALAVLVVACPCALGLATPMALLVASDRAARHGIFVTGQQALESARGIDTVVLDKTGTVTEGRLSVREAWFADGADPDLVLRLVGAAENASPHPLAVAVTQYARGRGVEVPLADDIRSLDGRGVSGSVEGHRLLVGSARLLADDDVDIPEGLARWVTDQEASAAVCVLGAVDGRAVVALALTDQIKASAAAAVERLHALGLRTVLLTGDHRAAALAVAAAVGVQEVIAGVLPAEKVAVVGRLQAQGRRVAMVGDGVNDGPALARADLGLALMSGTDVARAAADLLLCSGDLRVVPEAIELARSTLRTIRWNLVWAFGYNLAALPLAAAGLLNPVIAAAAMAFSSLFVVSNSLRLADPAHSAATDPRPSSGGRNHQ